MGRSRGEREALHAELPLGDRHLEDPSVPRDDAQRSIAVLSEPVHGEEERRVEGFLLAPVGGTEAEMALDIELVPRAAVELPDIDRRAIVFRERSVDLEEDHDPVQLVVAARVQQNRHLVERVEQHPGGVHPVLVHRGVHHLRLAVTGADEGR